MNWKGLLGGVAVGVGTTLKDRADAAQKERLQELAFAKQQLLKREDNAFQSQEAEKSRTFTAGQDEVKSSRTFENQSALMKLENEYNAPTREADIAAKRANTTESLARAKYYGEGGGGAGGAGGSRTTAAIQNADALVAAARMNNPNMSQEEESIMRMKALGAEVSNKDRAKMIQTYLLAFKKENVRIGDRRINEMTRNEQMAEVSKYVDGQIANGSAPLPVQTTTTAAPERVEEYVRGPDGKPVRK